MLLAQMLPAGFLSDRQNSAVFCYRKHTQINKTGNAEKQSLILLLRPDLGGLCLTHFHWPEGLSS